MSVNREIYEKHYSAVNVEVAPKNKYDAGITRVRQEYLERLVPGNVVLDVGCGTGSYLMPVLDRARCAYGLDFSRKMLIELERRVPPNLRQKLRTVEADAREIPLRDGVVDFAFAFTSLYHIPDVADVLREIGRVLRRGGVAVLEMGNHHSLNTVIAEYHHERNGWAKCYHVPFGDMPRMMAEAGLEIVHRRSFQLSPLYGGPKRYFYLYPLLTPVWKPILGAKIRGKMLDEHMASAWPLRYLAFRHFFEVRKASS